MEEHPHHEKRVPDASSVLDAAITPLEAATQAKNEAHQAEINSPQAQLTSVHNNLASLREDTNAPSLNTPSRPVATTSSKRHALELSPGPSLDAGLVKEKKRWNHGDDWPQHSAAYTTGVPNLEDHSHPRTRTGAIVQSLPTIMGSGIPVARNWTLQEFPRLKPHAVDSAPSTRPLAPGPTDPFNSDALTTMETAPFRSQPQFYRMPGQQQPSEVSSSYELRFSQSSDQVARRPQPQRQQYRNHELPYDVTPGLSTPSVQHQDLDDTSTSPDGQLAQPIQAQRPTAKARAGSQPVPLPNITNAPSLNTPSQPVATTSSERRAAIAPPSFTDRAHCPEADIAFLSSLPITMNMAVDAGEAEYIAIDSAFTDTMQKVGEHVAETISVAPRPELLGFDPVAGPSNINKSDAAKGRLQMLIQSLPDRISETAAQAKNKAQEAEINTLRTQLTSAQAENEAHQAEINRLQAAAQAKDEAQEAEINTLRSQLTSAPTPVQSLPDRISESAAQLTSVSSRVQSLPGPSPSVRSHLRMSFDESEPAEPFQFPFGSQSYEEDQDQSVLPTARPPVGRRPPPPRKAKATRSKPSSQPTPGMGRPKKRKAGDTDIERVLFVGVDATGQSLYKPFDDLSPAAQKIMLDSFNAEYVSDERKTSLYENVVAKDNREASMLKAKCVNMRLNNRAASVKDSE